MRIKWNGMDEAHIYPGDAFGGIFSSFSRVHDLIGG